MKPTKVVGLQALTRDIPKMDVNEFHTNISRTVAKAKEKAKTVVLPTVIYQEDLDDIQYAKRGIDLINAFIIFTFSEDKDVVICDNSKLNDPNFRFEDKLHLSDTSTSVLALNLKSC